MNPGLIDSMKSQRAGKYKPALVHELFEMRASQTPDAIAVRYEDAGWTYKQLNERANQLAHYLKKLGVAREVPVALCLERSLDMIMAIIAVLKAGGAYVPVDLAYPAERLGFMLEDTSAPVLLTQQNLLASLPPHKAKAVCLDSQWADVSGEPVQNLPQEAAGDNVAYIIYTSGSTGIPKGVLVTHHNVARLFTSTDASFGFNASDVWTLFHSYAFDFSVWELWGALIYGGRLVVVPYLVSRSPSDFYELLGREGVTVLNQTPSAFRQLIWAEASARSKRPLALRYVIFGGEALELQSLKPWFDAHGDQKPCLVNMYGITETTVHVTHRPITSRDLEEDLGSVIGVPLPDLKIHLLDETLKPVGPLQPGEMFVGGEGVARGYLNRPDLSQERFIPDPFAGNKGERLYRTGDLARRLESGELEYLGRLDHQIKIRGFRIELGEIEAALNRHSAVRESVVLARTAQDGDKRLVAYVVPAHEEMELAELRQHLARILPEYMIPASFVFLKSVPLTPNGKVDRNALPAPDRARPMLKDDFVPPCEGPGQILAGIWSEVLEIEPVGLNDNFFELGGDSIRAITLLARGQQCGLKFSLQQLFAHPTIGGLLGCLESGLEKGRFVPSAPFSLISEQDREKLPSDVEDAYPMIQLQTGMFYYNELNPASAVYHDVFSFQIQSFFDRDRIEEATRRLLARHPVLRTSFHLGEYSEPMQLVHRQVELPFTVENLSALSPEEQEKELVRYIDTEKRVPFDRTVAPLIRFHSQIHGSHSFQFIVSFHHVVMDGWSLARLITEVLEEYSELIEPAGRAVTAPCLYYRDFVALERESMASEQCRSFWAELIKDVSVRTLPRWPKEMRPGGQEQVRGPEIQIPQSVLEGLRQIARNTGVPLKSVLLAAHQRVMGFLQGQSDVISGLVCNGRPEEVDGDKVIGLFLNTLPLRLRLDGGTWTDLVKNTFSAEQAIIPNRRFPLAAIQELNGGQPLFEAAFDFVHFYVYKHLHGYREMGFLEGHYFEANNLATLTTFMLDVTSTHLQMHIDYDPNLLCHEQVQIISDYYSAVIEAMVSAPESRYECFSPMRDSERKQVLVEWNATEAEYPREKCIHHLFEEQARKTPGALAVAFGEHRLTYGELDEKAARLAQHLRKLGGGPEALVGVCLERSENMIVGLLAVLKAGAAYVPLDPAFPRERLSHMIADAHLSMIVTEEKLLAHLPPSTARTVLVNSAPDPVALPEPAAVASNNLAYVIYTSGSTGKPKGVQIAHRSVVNLLCAMAQRVNISSQDNLLAVTTISFDIAGLEIFLPLICGAHVTIASQQAISDATELSQLIGSSGATVMQATPATWRMLIEAGWEGKPNLLILCGGEALSPSLALSLIPRAREVWNVYGPTETTIWSTAWKVGLGAVTLVGKPLANTKTYILDHNLQPVPVGVTGELYIGGDGLARGYLNLPGLTAEKFIQNPFEKGANTRIYKTGDLARYWPDGQIECLGRLDNQVKVRGFRIELGEIESVLRRMPAVKEALVLAREDAPGDQKLAAYIIPSETEPPALPELREFLQRLLPDYMIPTGYVFLESFPLNPSGKIDRQALPAPGQGRPAFCNEYVAPRTPLEADVAAIWQGVFQIDQVGAEDSFFDLGGHSLTAVQVIVRVREQFGIDLPLSALFAAPTVSGLVQAMFNQMLTTENGGLAEMAREVAEMSDEEARRQLTLERGDKR